MNQQSGQPHHPHPHDFNHSDAHHVRGTFAGKIGFILAAAGSAVGLGNIWRFPYLTGENGGAAFILVYLICIALVGMPVMLAEFVIGRSTQTNQVAAYKELAPGKPWFLNGAMGLVTGLLILGFYCPVAGWVLDFGVKMTLGLFKVKGMTDPQMMEYFGAQTAALTGGTWEPLIWMVVIMAMTAGIISFGIESGIERACKVLMPMLIIIMLLLMLRSLTLPGIDENHSMSQGLAFLFKPDWSKITPTAVLEALGQAFFTLSLAMGAMMTYASYVNRDINLSRMVVNITALDTLVALLAGLIIFPAVFAFGLEPSSGPTLIFVTLPTIFAKMHFGRLIGATFFLLVTVAAITSTISLLEPIVTWLVDDHKLNRRPATWLTSLVVILFGIPACLSAGDTSPLAGFKIPFIGGEQTIFGLYDAMTSNLMMPIGGFVICMFIRFGWQRSRIVQETVGTHGRPGFIIFLWYRVVTIITPILILLVLLNKLGVF